MLVSGEIDAALSAHPPACFEQGHPNVALMFPDYLEIEQKYVKETGIFPIMHAVAIKREIVEKHPWIAANLFAAFEEAKRRSVKRALNNTSSALPIPWGYEFARRMQDDRRRGAVAVRHRRQPQDARCVPAIRLRAGRAAQADAAGGAVPAAGARSFRV